MRSHRSLTVVVALLALVASAGTLAEPAPFDLAGPTLEVTVTRGSATLPVARVPNLSPGDRLAIKAVLPEGQSAHYLMVGAFLRGSTDPPPPEWFSRCKTWTGKCAREGMTLTVPKDARQLLVFLAPETGGDFDTLVNAVRGRPGVFVRTSQDLNQAALEHRRLEAYLAAIRSLGDADPVRLREVAPLLSRSLAIKVDEKCLDKNPVLQASCLMQGRESLIMSDGHSASMAQELTSGPASDLAMEASNTPQLKSGYYGPFIGSALDIARLLDSFHTAHYQYIPALAFAQGRELRLTLNAPPSFHDPKSVLVIALPAVEPPQFPPLRPVEPREVYCLRKQPLILPVEGAPLLFASDYAHGLTLGLSGKGATPVELPARADAAQGGLVIDTSTLRGVALDGSVRASLQAEWGFDTYTGPSFQLLDPRGQSWQLASGDEAALVIGRQDAIRLRAGSAKCLEEIALQDSSGRHFAVEWKSVKADEVEARLSLQEASPGEMSLLIRQYGADQPQRLVLHAYAEAARLESFALRIGDTQGVLRGTRLDEVEKLTARGVEFRPGTLVTREGRDELSMLAGTAASAPGGSAGETPPGRVTLKDGRTLDVRVLIEPARPSAVLIAKSVQLSRAGPASNIHLANPDELPQDAKLTFSLRAQFPPSFAPEEKIEVATSDGASSTLLDFSHGAMTLQNARVAVATLDPAKEFGGSAFGPLRFRRVVNGISSEWQPLATLVRLPLLRDLQCPGDAGSGCTLSGASLFLLDSVSGDARFSQPTSIPDGFTGEALSVPRPTDGQLYLRLRDDPAVISVATPKMQGASAAPAAVPPEPAPSTIVPAPKSSDRAAQPASEPNAPDHST